jgi:ligand-binding SRPBCC domain-containing protein
MEIEFSVRVPVPRERLFAFHANPDNLRLLLAGWKYTEVLSTEGHIEPGARLCVLERMGPLKLRFTFEQFVYEPPRCFGERMVRGLFRRFEHVHEFEEVGDDRLATLVHDRITVELPWWLGGALATRWLVTRRLRRFFAHRRRAYERLAVEGRLCA